MAGGGFLALLALGAMAALASGASSSPPARRTGPYHWHVTSAFRTKQKYYLEPQYTNAQGHAVYKCLFCQSVYVKRPRRR
jgi:hypothetical protein